MVEDCMDWFWYLQANNYRYILLLPVFIDSIDNICSQDIKFSFGQALCFIDVGLKLCLLVEDIKANVFYKVYVIYLYFVDLNPTKSTALISLPCTKGIYHTWRYLQYSLWSLLLCENIFFIVNRFFNCCQPAAVCYCKGCLYG